MSRSEFEIGVIESRLFSENCYIAYFKDRDDCLVFDPGLEPDEIIEWIERRNLTPAAILNTHGHADHIAGNNALKARWPAAPLMIGEHDAAKLSDPKANLSAVYGLPFTSVPADRLLKAGEHLSLAGMSLEVLFTPGHSAGHVVFVWKEPSPWMVFGGDVLFAGGIGRTDFPDGNYDHLVKSIKSQLFTLPDDTQVLPGHGPPTTVGEEKESNPFVGRGV